MNIQHPLLRSPFLPLVNPFSTIPQAVSTNSAFLSKLFCQALKISLQRFTAAQIHKPQKYEITKPATKPYKIQPEVIELLSSEEQFQKDDFKSNHRKKIEKLETNKFEIRELEEKTDLSKDHGQFQKQLNGTVQKHEENKLRKKCLIRKQKNIKGIKKMKKNKYFSVQQNLDWTDCVEINRVSFSVDQLKKKRQGLFLRAVSNWDEAEFQKKERREIRMLQN